MPNEGDVAHLAPAHSVSISSEDHWGREVPSPIVKNCISGDRSFPLGFQTSPRAPNYPSLAASHVVLAWFLIGNITCVVSSAHDGGEQPRKKVAVPSKCDPGRRSLTLYMTESKKASFARPARRRLVVPSPGTRQAAVRGRPSSLDPVRYPDFRFFCPSRLLPYSVPARTLQRRLR
ncbi:hypothetical protein CCHR01_11628 [Colletotrichum chrysophilum]|uniref:Uncharacterized protein n=1 Tax=Colletotrichum chrysophilum TaxID=1836956 RepID=A0AAD9EC68_9PEZI|nr:hypothetical protein CCHR01_11628 [Colletotrichum chrysophilum]